MTRTVLMTVGLPDGTGAHRMAVQFARAFLREGHRVVLVCGSGSKADEDPLLLGDAGSPPPDGVTVLRRDGFSRLLGGSLVSELRRIVDREGADGVIGFQQADRKHVMLAARRAGVPCVIHAGNQHTFWGPGPVPALKGWLYGQLLRRFADLVVCTSDTVASEVVQRFGVPRERIRVQPNGIDVRGFPRPDTAAVEDVRDELGLAPEDVMLINVGRLDVQKGQDLLLEALAPIAASRSDVKLVLVGAVTGSSNREQMQGFAARLRDLVDAHGLGSRVVFAGWRDNVPRLLGAADLYVHAARWEGPSLCLAALEGMAAALPLIVTDCSGHPAGFENGEHGFVVRAGAAEPLREALDRLVGLGPEERRAMGARARALALERYDIRGLGARFVRHVEGALA